MHDYNDDGYIDRDEARTLWEDEVMTDKQIEQEIDMVCLLTAINLSRIDWLKLFLFSLVRFLFSPRHCGCWTKIATGACPFPSFLASTKEQRRTSPSFPS